MRDVEDRENVGIGDLGTLDSRPQRSRTHPSSQNVKLLVWKTHVAWVSANSGVQEGLKMTEEWTGLLQHFVGEVGYCVILQASGLVGNYA